MDKRVQEFLKQQLSNPQPAPCVLCGTLTRNRVVFLPGNSQDYGAAEGKTRYIIYPRCAKHPETVETAMKAEAALLGDDWLLQAGQA